MRSKQRLQLLSPPMKVALRNEMSKVRLPSPAVLLASIALFVALTGGAIAAGRRSRLEPSSPTRLASPPTH
jgi:hypothetical protein